MRLHRRRRVRIGHDRQRRDGRAPNLRSYGRDEAVASPRQRFHISGLLRVIAERSTNLINTKVDASFKIYKGIVAPEPLTDFFAGDDVPSTVCEHDQNFYGLAAQLDGDSTLAQFAARGVQIEGAEANPREQRG